MSVPRQPNFRSIKKPLPKELSTPIPVYFLSASHREAMKEEIFQQKLGMVFALHGIPSESKNREELLLRKLLPQVYAGFREVHEKTRGRGRPREEKRHDKLLQDFEMLEVRLETKNSPIKGTSAIAKELSKRYPKQCNGMSPGAIENVVRDARMRRSRSRMSPRIRALVRMLIVCVFLDLDRRHFKIHDQIVTVAGEAGLIDASPDGALTLTKRGRAMMREDGAF